MQLEKLTKVHDGKYLKSYELTYLNNAGKEKKYEIVSRKELPDTDALGKSVSGVSIVAYKGDKMLLLREFRMAVNKEIFNLCAGMIENDETIEECISRELYEETGLTVKRIIKILPSCYSAVGISDIKTHIAFVEVDGEIEYHTSDNEEIKAAFYSKKQIKELLETEEFSSRSQMAAYCFTIM